MLYAGVGFVPASLSRFAIGFVCTLIIMLVRKQSLRSERPGLLVARGFANAVGVTLFFAALTLTTVTKANMLAQLSPAFVFLFSPFINHESQQRSQAWYLLPVFAGSALIIMPEGGLAALLSSGDLAGDLVALTAAVTGGIAVSLLREARKTDGTLTVILYQFAVGIVVSLVLSLFSWQTPPDALSWLILLATGAFGFAGQLVIIWSYKHVSATEGSLLSNSGILTSAAVGIVLFGDRLHPLMLAGACLLLVALLGLSGVRLRSK